MGWQPAAVDDAESEPAGAPHNSDRLFFCSLRAPFFCMCAFRLTDAAICHSPFHPPSAPAAASVVPELNMDINMDHSAYFAGIDSDDEGER